MSSANIIALIKSNEEQRTIARSTDTRVIAGMGANLYVVFTFPELRKVEKVLHVQFETNPETWITAQGGPQDKTYDKNTVGMSLYIATAAGTTLTSECIAIGF